MKKKILVIIITSLIVLFLYFVLCISSYLYTQKQNEKYISQCSQYENATCYNKMFELLIPKLLLKEIAINSEKPKLTKVDWQARYSVQRALDVSDLLLGYGIGNNAEYENHYSIFYNKPTYCYDCGIPFLRTDTPKVQFFSECIGTDDFVIEGQISSEQIHTFKEKFEELNLKDKQIYIKMDIAGAEGEVLPEILKYSDNISGMLITMHFVTTKGIIERLPILDELNEKYVLVGRNTIFKTGPLFEYNIQSKYYEGKLVERVLALSYINKKYVDNYKISLEQNSNKYYLNKCNVELKSHYKLSSPNSDISFVVTLVEKIKEIIKGKNK